MSVTTIANLALLVGLSFFFGLAFEDFYLRSGEKRPGGVRTFPFLAITGGALYLLDPTHLVPMTAGLLILGAWLFAYYRHSIRGHDATGAPDVGLMVPICNVLAYLLGPIALTQPHWLTIGVTVAAVFFFTGRERLHRYAQRIELREIVIAGQFLALTGLVLPLLPDEPVTTLTSITPYKAWLALLAVCAISYASYLLRHYVAPEGADLWTAALGGLYSSTAATVVLARRARAEPAAGPRAEAGIVLATALMYPRLFAVIFVFNRPLAWVLAPSLFVLCLLGLAAAWLQYRRADAPQGKAQPGAGPRNPLELSAAAVFAILFVTVSILSSWVNSRFGAVGIDVLAAIVGVTDVDPFVLSLAQGVAAPLPLGAAAGAVLIAASSNNLLKAGYAAAFSGLRASFATMGALIILALAGVGIAFWITAHSG
jgi:uncharacterized membrane protein (DUF4010 family)